MKTEFTCSRCGQAFATDRDLSGRRVRCRNCGLVQRISGAGMAPSGAPSNYQLGPAPVTSSGSVPTEPGYFSPAPARQAQRSRFGWLQHLRPWVFETSQVQGIGTWLIILTAADLLMTFVLLRRSTAFFESNPIAQWFFVRWNMTGMVFFKFSIIGGVILASEIIERKRPGWGRFVLLVGCLGAACAVFQASRLYMADTMPMAADLD